MKTSAWPLGNLAKYYIPSIRITHTYLSQPRVVGDCGLGEEVDRPAAVGVRILDLAQDAAVRRIGLEADGANCGEVIT